MARSGGAHQRCRASSVFNIIGKIDVACKEPEIAWSQRQRESEGARGSERESKDVRVCWAQTCPRPLSTPVALLPPLLLLLLFIFLLLLLLPTATSHLLLSNGFGDEEWRGGRGVNYVFKTSHN